MIAVRRGRGANLSPVTPRDHPHSGTFPHRTRWGIRYLCFACGARCDGPAMFCPTHLAAVELRP